MPLNDTVKKSLSEWKNDRGIKPYLKIKALLTELKTVNLYPCNGLLLIEVLLVLLKLNEQHGDISLFRYIHNKRREYYQDMRGDVRVDLIRYSDFLWGKLSNDLSNYHAANYPARSTLMFLMQFDELVYGQVPGEIFGLIQYVTISES